MRRPSANFADAGKRFECCALPAGAAVESSCYRSFRQASVLFPPKTSAFDRFSFRLRKMATSVFVEKENMEATSDVSVECKRPRVEEERLQIRFVKLNPDAQTPSYGSAGAAGADLCSVEDCVVPANGKMCISTGLQIEIPFGYYGRVAPRSGLAARNFIDVGAGVVDCDYRGELKVLLFNFGPTEFEVKKGDRIAQLICERIAHVHLWSVNH